MLKYILCINNHGCTIYIFCIINTYICAIVYIMYYYHVCCECGTLVHMCVQRLKKAFMGRIPYSPEGASKSKRNMDCCIVQEYQESLEVRGKTITRARLCYGVIERMFVSTCDAEGIFLTNLLCVLGYNTYYSNIVMHLPVKKNLHVTMLIMLIVCVLPLQTHQ
jgi:hypothetical protein